MFKGPLYPRAGLTLTELFTDRYDPSTDPLCDPITFYSATEAIFEVGNVFLVLLSCLFSLLVPFPSSEPSVDNLVTLPVLFKVFKTGVRDLVPLSTI